MKRCEKRMMFEKLISENISSVREYYETLEVCRALKKNYHDYMTTAPIDCDVELRRLATADYDLSCVLLTMLLREDHFNNGIFERRYIWLLPYGCIFLLWGTAILGPTFLVRYVLILWFALPLFCNQLVDAVFRNNIFTMIRR